MNHLSYEQYRSDPAIREAIDADVARMRQQAFDRYVWDPIAAALKAAFTFPRTARRAPQPAPSTR